MIEDMSTNGRRRRFRPEIVAGIWILAVCAPLVFMLTNVVGASARRDAEQLLLAQVAAASHSPNSGRDQVLSAVERNARLASDERFLRVCGRLGIPSDWKSLFRDVKRRGPEDQARVARIIAEECGIDTDANLRREEAYLAVNGPTGAVHATGPLTPHLLKSEN